MARGAELSSQTRSRIYELHYIRYNAKRIHSIHPKWSLNTIKSTLRRKAIRINNSTRQYASAPRKISEIERDHIYDTISHINPHTTNQDLLADVDKEVLKRIIQRLIRELGRRKWRQRSRPDIIFIYA